MNYYVIAWVSILVAEIMLADGDAALEELELALASRGKPSEEWDGTF
jgi:hypothetical protein